MFESFKENRSIVYKPDSLFIIPYRFFNGRAVVYQNKIHLLGGAVYGDTEDKKHYAWDGTTWTSVSTLPYDFYGGAAVVYDGKIHILGSNDTSHNTKHYAWNGTSWSSVSTLPTTLFDGRAVVYGGKIHVFGFGANENDNYEHYSYNGSSWTFESYLGVNPSSSTKYGLQRGGVDVYQDYIYVIPTTNGGTPLKWNGTNGWQQASSTSLGEETRTATTYGDSMYFFSRGTDKPYAIYKLTGTAFTTKELVFPYYLGFAEGIVFNNKLYAVGGGYSISYAVRGILDVTTMDDFI